MQDTDWMTVTVSHQCTQSCTIRPRERLGKGFDVIDELKALLITELNLEVTSPDDIDASAPLFRDGSDPDVTKARVDAYNERIVQAVADAGCVLVVLSTIELTDDLTWIDGFHPSNEGHAVLADAYWSEIAPRTLP